jgi:hypothetical protein
LVLEHFLTVSGMSTDSSRSSSSEGLSDMMLSTLRLTSLGFRRRRRSLELLAGLCGLQHYYEAHRALSMGSAMSNCGREAVYGLKVGLFGLSEL